MRVVTASVSGHDRETLRNVSITLCDLFLPRKKNRVANKNPGSLISTPIHLHTSKD